MKKYINYKVNNFLPLRGFNANFSNLKCLPITVFEISTKVQKITNLLNYENWNSCYFEKESQVFEE